MNLHPALSVSGRIPPPYPGAWVVLSAKLNVMRNRAVNGLAEASVTVSAG
ncbi:MAG: hypothetical protein LC723_13635 [Actinobacteria bacterium]|nr:hypothetical protein [Actinomycetota bacterium]